MVALELGQRELVIDIDSIRSENDVAVCDIHNCMDFEGCRCRKIWSRKYNCTSGPLGPVTCTCQIHPSCPEIIFNVVLRSADLDLTRGVVTYRTFNDCDISAQVSRIGITGYSDIRVGSGTNTIFGCYCPPENIISESQTCNRC